MTGSNLRGKREIYFVTEERNIVLMCRGKGAGTKGEAEDTERGKIL